MTPIMPSVKILAPLSGQVWSLDRIPDPVFAQKMVGDGLSIDPSDARLVAACDGKVIAVHAAGHAVTLLTPEGMELLMHVGIDTVTLKGQGFKPRVGIGDQVKAGDPLIDFDLDYLATHAKSLLTQIVVTNSDHVTSWERAHGLVSAGKDVLFTVDFKPNGAAAATNGSGVTLTSDAIVIPNPTGLHARPAAVLANVSKSFQSAIKLKIGDREANARSVTAIMGLDVKQNDSVRVIAMGPDAKAALEKLTRILSEGSGDEGCKPAPAPATTVVTPSSYLAPSRKSADPNVLLGVTASPGLAVGEVFQVRRTEIAVVEAGAGVDHERRRLTSALEVSRAQLAALRESLHAKREAAKAAIFAAHEELLGDPDLLEMAESGIAKGKSAAFAWQRAIATHADQLAGMSNQLLAQRANDVRDVGMRVLSTLTGTDASQPEYPLNSILIAEDFTPSDTAALDRSRVAGFCTTRGGATSHVAIIARSVGIPALAGVEPDVLDVPNGTRVILDGSKGTLRLRVTPEEVARIQKAQERAEVRRKENLANAQKPATMLDGVRLEVVANIGNLKDAKQISSLGGEGVGLLRSEFLFMDRPDAPSEEEQFKTYQAIAEAVGPRNPFIIRTLDVGGDKPLAYLPIPKEDNPFLGERGVRVGLARPEILRTQLRAILRASGSGKIKIMFPMIATLSELRDVKAMLAEEAASLGVAPVPAGIMVEIPAAAMMAEQFAAESDFFSIGTNDLTQYTLAMDRGHPKLAPQVDALNPAVLRLIGLTAKGAAPSGRMVGVCGGIASDPLAVPILIGLGVTELSVSLPAIPAVKAQIRKLRLDACRELAERALAAESANAVRALVPDPDA
jgi:phosphocarrier protein FPr